MPSPPDYLIVIGTSAGGMPALIRLVEQLPDTLPAAILVVQHLAPNSTGIPLVNRLAEHSTLHCQLAVTGTPLQAGALYFAPADQHLLVKDNTIQVTKGPHENGFRPSVDALFRAAAVAYGPCVVGVVLTGLLHDGTAGLDFVKRCGGIAVVQDPYDAEFPSMPESALRNVDIDYVLPLDRMGPLLTSLVQQPVPDAPRTAIPEDLKVEAAVAERVVGGIEDMQQIGHQVPLTCPDCGGALWQLDQGNVLRYRCHTGHSFTAEALLEGSRHSLEETLWVALRMMEERRNLLSSMATRGQSNWNLQQEERLEEIKLHINRLREFLLTSVNGARLTDL